MPIFASNPAVANEKEGKKKKSEAVAPNRENESAQETCAAKTYPIERFKVVHGHFVVAANLFHLGRKLAGASNAWRGDARICLPCLAASGIACLCDDDGLLKALVSEELLQRIALALDVRSPVLLERVDARVVAVGVEADEVDDVGDICHGRAAGKVVVLLAAPVGEDFCGANFDVDAGALDGVARLFDDADEFCALCFSDKRRLVADAQVCDRAVRVLEFAEELYEADDLNVVELRVLVDPDAEHDGHALVARVLDDELCLGEAVEGVGLNALCHGRDLAHVCLDLVFEEAEAALVLLVGAEAVVAEAEGRVVEAEESGLGGDGLVAVVVVGAVAGAAELGRGDGVCGLVQVGDALLVDGEVDADAAAADEDEEYGGDAADAAHIAAGVLGHTGRTGMGMGAQVAVLRCDGGAEVGLLATEGGVETVRR